MCINVYTNDIKVRTWYLKLQPGYWLVRKNTNITF